MKKSTCSIKGKATEIKTWQEKTGRWHVDWKEGANTWTTGGGIGFPTEKAALDWLKGA